MMFLWTDGSVTWENEWQKLQVKTSPGGWGTVRRWHFSGDQFYTEVGWRRYFRWARCPLQNSTQEQASLGDGEVNRWVPIALLPQFSSLWIQKLFHDELAINRGSVFLLFLCGRRERVWNFICLSKWCDVQEGQSFQDMFNSLSSLAFNTMFIIKYAPEFIFFCQAVGQWYLAMANTLFYVWIFLTVILCVNFF